MMSDFQQAYVLHTRPYLETSLLIELFTEDCGRIAVIAKGAERPKSKFKGILQSFTPLWVSCVGKGELLTLVDAEINGIPHYLNGKWLMSAFYVNELLMRLLNRWDAHNPLFEYYRISLNQLEKRECEQKTLRLFEKCLLKELGYALPLAYVVGTPPEPINPEHDYLFDPELGPIYVKQKSSVNKHIFKGSSLISLAEERLEDKRALIDAKRIMRQALRIYLGPRPLESRNLF